MSHKMEHSFSTQVRSDSNHKWCILTFVSTLWIASSHCLLSTASLEDDLLSIFHLSQTQFAMLSGAACFIFAVLGSLVTPYFIRRCNLYNTMTISCILCTIGQAVFVVGVALPIQSSTIYIMYIGRMLVGFAYGVHNVTIFCTVNVWFKYNTWLSFALNVANSTYTIGILTSRFALVPIYQSTGYLSLAFLFGVVLSFISVIACFCMWFVEKHFVNHCTVRLSETNVAIVDFDHDFRKIKLFNLDIWLLVVIIIIGWSSIETFNTQITEPIVNAFGVSEKNVDWLLSIQSWLSLTVAQLWGYLSSKYGYLSHILISSQLFLTLGIVVLYAHGIDAKTEHDKIASFEQIQPEAMIAVIVIVYSIGLQQFFAVSITCLSLICPLELLSIANSVVSIGFMIGSAIESALFGVIADATESDHWSLMLMILLTMIGTIIAFHVHVVDVFTNGPLHARKHKKNNAELVVQQQTSSGVNNERQPLLESYAEWKECRESQQ